MELLLSNDRWVVLQVGEHILSLFQQLEDFAASDALQEVLAVMSGLDRLGEGDWKEVSTVLGLSESESSALFKVMAGEGFEGWVEQPQVDDEEGGEQGDRSAIDDSAHFCSEWLDSIAKATAGGLLARILEIPSISHHGAAQIAMDCTYLLNVLANLEVNPPPILWMLRSIMDMSEDQLSQRAGDKTRSGTSAASLIVKKVEKRIITLRGVVAK